MAHTLPIAPDWEFTRIRTGDTQTFAFHTSPSCPGYSFDVSHWRLRKENRERLCGDLDLGPHNYQQVERALGTSAFVGTSRALQEIQEKSMELVATSRIPDGPIEVTAALTPAIQQRILAVAAMQDFQSPPVSLLVVPLCSLEIRDRTRYLIDPIPWPFSTPPKALIHLASSGFKCGSSCGILAVAPDSDDLWIVSKFSQCEVGVTSDLACNLAKAFSRLNELETCAAVEAADIHTIRETTEAHRVALNQLQADLGTRGTQKPRRMGGIPLASATPRYMMREGLGHWLFTVDGLDGSIADEKGLTYVEYLFKNPPELPLHATELEALVRKVSTSPTGTTELVDPKTGTCIPLALTAHFQERNLGLDDTEANKRLWSHRNGCKRTIDDKGASEVEREEARKEMAALDHFLRETTLRNRSNATKTYDRIRQAITRLLKHLDSKTTKHGLKEPPYEALAEHIRRYLISPSLYARQRRARTRTAQTFMYERPDGVIWSD